MPIDFPNSPANGATYTVGTKTWQFDGTSWNLVQGDALIGTGSVTSDKIADSAVTTAKIADGAITSDKIANGTITNDDIASGANINISKLSGNAPAQMLVNANTGYPQYRTISGDWTMDYLGVATISNNAVTAGKLGTDVQLGYRNVVINGAMQIAQRGTSVASITAAGYRTADRYNLAIDSLGTWTQSVENDAPTGSGFRKSLKMNCTTADATPAAGDYCFLSQVLEGQNLQQFLKGTASAKAFTLTFWVKSNVTGTYIAEIYDLDNSRQVSASYTISASATWEKKTITFPADTTGAFDNDNAGSMQVDFFLAAGTNWTGGTLQTTWAGATLNKRASGQTNLAAATNNYWQITGVQLEAGSVATPFEFEDYSTTLLKCERYYQELKLSAYFATCSTESTTNGRSTLHLRTRMRAAPGTITLPAAGSGAGQIAVLNASGGYPATIGTHTAANATETQFNLNFGSYTSAWLGSGVAAQFYSNGASTISCSAEL